MVFHDGAFHARRPDSCFCGKDHDSSTVDSIWLAAGSDAFPGARFYGHEHVIGNAPVG